jgi:hypothetical protein
MLSVVLVRVEVGCNDKPQPHCSFDYNSKRFYSVGPPEDMFAFDSLKPTSVVEIDPFVRSRFKLRQQG